MLLPPSSYIYLTSITNIKCEFIDLLQEHARLTIGSLDLLVYPKLSGESKANIQGPPLIPKTRFNPTPTIKMYNQDSPLSITASIAGILTLVTASKQLIP
jgi:hypothetical protein